MPVHDWTKVDAGIFHDFHCAWIIHLKESLNEGLLPDGFYAMAEQHARDRIPRRPDALALPNRTGAARPSRRSGRCPRRRSSSGQSEAGCGPGVRLSHATSYVDDPPCQRPPDRGPAGDHLAGKQGSRLRASRILSRRSIPHSNEASTSWSPIFFRQANTIPRAYTARSGCATARRTISFHQGSD